MSEIKFTIDGKECTAKPGQTVLQAAKDNNVDIPYLCDHPEIKSAGRCRICTVKIGGKNVASCTTPVTEGMMVSNEVDDITKYRKDLVDMFFVEGNHYCPACEKSGNCRLQATAYKYQIMSPRYPFLFPNTNIEAGKNILLDHNRCIRCGRCERGIKSADGKNVFALIDRGGKTNVVFDKKLEAKLSDVDATKAMDNCPVGAILKKEIGFVNPIGSRKYDKKAVTIQS